MDLALTPGQQAFYDLLCTFASEGKPCPRNVELSERMGVTATQISNYLGTLRTKGLIRTEHRGGSRTILIVASGALIESAVRMSTPGTPAGPIARVEGEVIYTMRDPCFYCGVRADAAIKCAKCAG